jgi:hypothetical protein
MAITQAMCTSFKKELLTGTHNFTNSTGDTFKIALYTSSATLGASTPAYTATNEVSGTGYTATGETLTNVTPTTSGTSGITDFDDVNWTNSTITANGALIYNDTAAGDPSVVVLFFGSDKSSSGGTFTVSFPAAAAGTAIIEIA